MKGNKRGDETSALKPVGLALAAVVAGIGVGKADSTTEPRAHAPLEPAGHANTYFLDPTNHPGFEEDPNLVFGESAPAAVLLGAGDEDNEAEFV